MYKYHFYGLKVCIIDSIRLFTFYIMPLRILYYAYCWFDLKRLEISKVGPIWVNFPKLVGKLFDNGQTL